MLPVNCGSHADYQNLVVENLRKYYPDPNAFSRDTWDIIERFWNLDLSFTDETPFHQIFQVRACPKDSVLHAAFLPSVYRF